MSVHIFSSLWDEFLIDSFIINEDILKIFYKSNPLKHLAVSKENHSFCQALAVQLESAEMAVFNILHPSLQQTLSFGCDQAITF